MEVPYDNEKDCNLIISSYQIIGLESKDKDAFNSNERRQNRGYF